ncbi:AtpZ/AtpI family protein [Tenacibaculum sp. AHE15PA]|nr:AtpZ/AtpI family protein [Tenacibaculum sp. AHE15PA]
MGLTIYLGNLLGKWLDVQYPNNGELYSKICTLAAVFLAMFSVIRQVTKISKDND